MPTLRQEGLASEVIRWGSCKTLRWSSRNDVEYFYKWLGYTWGKHIGEWMDMYGDRKGCRCKGSV